MSNQKYFVGVDGSEWSDRAAECAVTIADDTGASVLFMFVTNWSDYSMMTVEGAMHRPADKAEEEKHAFDDVLNPLVEKYRDSGVAIETAHDWGDPRYVLLEKAKDIHASMIIMGRRGRSRFVDLVMGSVSNALVHSASVPVLLVP